MCGISGYIGDKKLNIETIKKTLYLMKKRGPDYQSYDLKYIQKRTVALLASRLSIIDLDPRSNQPFKDDNLTLIFNGEIYNFLELKSVLVKKGIIFKTQSDTEVLIKSYKYWGKNCVKKFEGMWAFAIFDKKKNIIFMSRDRFGEKPLFYYYDTKQFIFGSEIKFLIQLEQKKKLNQINLIKLKEYIVNGYKVLNKNNDTFFDKIKKLDSGTNLYLNLENMNLRSEKYYVKYKLIGNKQHVYTKDNINNVRYLLESSLKLRLRSKLLIRFKE